MSTMRTCLALATLNNWDIECWDVVTAFLNGDLEEDVYMRPPPGMTSYKGNSLAGKLLKIKKGLYGLCQAGRTWWKALDQWLMNKSINPNCTRGTIDTCVYTFKQDDSFVMIDACVRG